MKTALSSLLAPPLFLAACAVNVTPQPTDGSKSAAYFPLKGFVRVN